MSPDTSSDRIDLLAEISGGVAGVKETVVQWAIRGRLAPQFDSETTETQRQSARHAKLDAKGSKKVRWLSDDLTELPFPVPANWTWVCVGDAVDMINGRAFKSDEWSTSGLPIVRIQNLNNPEASFNHFDGDYDNKHKIESGSFLISWSGTPGTSFGAFIWDRGDALVNQHIFKCELYGTCFVHEYLRIAINARLEEMISHAQGGVGLRHITRGKLEGIPIPLPPLTEQERIVAKVDELMALCDRLEAQQQERETQHTTLARASLARFADAPTPANLNFLFHESYSIAPTDIRRTALALAVHGRLVRPNPSDEDVRVSLPQLDTVAVEPKDDGFPQHWLRVPLGEAGEWRGGGTPSKSRPDFWSGEIPWVSPKDMKVLRISDALDHISPEAVAGSSVRIIPTGSLLVVVRGMILARAFPVAIAECELTINQDMKALLPLHPEVGEFLLLSLRALEPEVLAGIERSSHGTCKLQTDFLHSLIIALPPLAEQARILAKVDELMSLIDQLEGQLSNSLDGGSRLLEAVVAELAA